MEGEIIENINNTDQAEITPPVTLSAEEVKQEVVTPKKEKGKKKKPLWRKITDWVITGIFGTLAVLTAAFMIYTNVAGDGMIGDYSFPCVLTDSMVPVYPVGTVLIVKKVDPASIKVGDDVMFKWEVNGKIMNMTHRIDQIDVIEQKQVGTGKYHYFAHGINTHSEFCKIGNDYGDCTYQHQEFTELLLVGKVIRTSQPLTYFYKFVQSKWGLIGLILIPCFYLMISSVIDLFKQIPDDDQVVQTTSSEGSGYKFVSNDPNNPLAGLSEEDIERLKKEMLDELTGKGGKK